jgi:hypothetical protein
MGPNVFKDTVLVVTRRLSALNLYLPTPPDGSTTPNMAQIAENFEKFKDAEETKRSPP